MSAHLKEDQKYFTRFSLNQRIQHWLLLGSFVLLALTGLPMRFPDAEWLGFIYKIVGGLPVARIIHRIAAVIMIVDGIIHLMYIISLLPKNHYKIFEAWPMLPTKKDAHDWWETT